MVSKKRIMVILAALVLSLCTIVSANAATCSKMTITSISASSSLSNGASVWLQNDTSVACGTIAAGGKMLFYVGSTHTDKTLAVLLTAMSLNKQLWVSFDDSTNPGLLITAAMLAD